MSAGGEHEIRVADAPERSRYELSVDGETAGLIAYQLRGTRIFLTHTEIGSEYEGSGLGSRLVRAMLDDLRVRGLEVMPFCPFVNGWIRRHREYADLVPAKEWARFDLEEDSAGE
jgi:uncharacterized protein